MQFVYPAFLFALAALAIPIIIHLFYFRRFRKVYFTNVRFLKEVKEDTSARSKLRNLLVLLARCLAVVFLVFAFVQPFIPQDAEVKQGRKGVSIFIDNSFSMSALSEDVPLLEKAKQRAREVVNAYGVEDEFQILTNDFEGRHQRMVSQEDALALIDEIAISPAVRDLSKVVTRQKQALSTSSADIPSSYIISDFQRNITDIQDFRDTSIQLNLIPLQAVQERNIAIDSAWFEAPVQMIGQNNPLLVRVSNLSDEDADNLRISINYDGQTKPVGAAAIPARSFVVDTVNLIVQNPGWYQGELAVTDYPVQFDDKYFFTFKVADKINVLVINEDQANRYLEAALGGISFFNMTNASSRNIDYSVFADNQLLILNELTSISSGLASELQQFVQNGGNLLIFPARNINLETYRSFLSGFPANEFIGWEDQAREVGQINTEEFIFNDVFENRSANLKMPAPTGNYRQSSFGPRKEEVLLSYRDGNSFLSKYQIDKGFLYVCAAPLNEDYNNLVRNAEIFVPMLYKMALSSGKRKPIQYTLGKDDLIESDHKATGGEIVYKLKGAEEEFIPEQRIVGSKVYLNIQNDVKEAGFYSLFLKQGEQLDQFAFNYDRKESVLDYYNPADLRAYVGSLASVITAADNDVLTARIEERSQGVVLWRWCLILALLFLAAEILLLRFWK